MSAFRECKRRLKKTIRRNKLLGMWAAENQLRDLPVLRDGLPASVDFDWVKEPDFRSILDDFMQMDEKLDAEGMKRDRE